jgi:predicted DsbA family dithiol-disulfide isomerase
MVVTVWSDVICPWAYLGRDRSALMEQELGCTVVRRPYELHPELPAAARPIRADGRYARVLDHIAELCVADGIAFRRPTRTSNSRDALLAIEMVRSIDPDAVDRFEGVLFHAHFVEDQLPASPEVLRDAFVAVGIDPTRLDDTARSAAVTALAKARGDAQESGVSATPSWLFPSGFVMPGAQSREQTRRWVSRIIERSERPGNTSADR